LASIEYGIDSVLAQAMPTPVIDSSSRRRRVNDGHRRQSGRAGKQAQRMRALGAAKFWRAAAGRTKSEAHRRVRAETEPGPLDTLLIERRAGIGRAKHIARHRDREIQPHAEEPEPRADLHERQLAHRLRHIPNGGQNLLHTMPDAGRDCFFTFERRHDQPAVFLSS
jgi:hypothetical protein